MTAMTGSIGETAQGNPWAPRNVEWVVKISKLCNLRCTYCYEYPFLGDPARMSIVQLRAMFQAIADFYGGSGKRMDFVWHGGEPLLIEPSYYESIFDLQREVFDPVGLVWTNSVQTNLTSLRPSVLDLLKADVFANIGISLDVFGDQRLNVAGRPLQDAVLRNMQALHDAGLVFGCITVLSQATKPHLARIYRFFEEIDTSFRVLPVYRTGYPGQQDALALDDSEIVAGFVELVDLWLRSTSSIQVRPIQDYFSNVVGYLADNGRRSYYDKAIDEVVYIVEPDGSLFSVADPPDARLCHGNIFESSLSDMKNSPGYLAAVREANERMVAACYGCKFHGICSGYFMGEATPEQRRSTADGKLTCGVARPVQEYIEAALRAVGYGEVVGA